MSSVKALPVGHVASPMYVVMDSSHGIKKNSHWTTHHEAANAQYPKRPPHPQLPGGSSHHSPPLTGTRGYPYPQDPTGGRNTAPVVSTYATSIVANSSPHHMPPHPPGGGAGSLFTTNHLYRDAHFQVDTRPQPSQQQQQQHPEVRPIEHRYIEQQHVRRRLNLRPTPEYIAGIERERYMEAIRYQYEREVALGGPFANAGVPRGIKPFVVSVHTPSDMDIGQPGKRPRLAAEPKAPVHQPLVIDTRNIVIKKEPAYNPQVEAISPTLPPEEGRCDSPMKILKENILGNINRLDKEIDQVESQVSKLQKKLHDLEAEASKPAVLKEAAKDVSHVESKQMSIAQIIYSENRTKALDSHATLRKLGPKVEMPLYNQPSDTAVYHENKRKYMTFKNRLVTFFKTRHQERESRENYLSDTYSKLMQEWSKKIEKRDSNPSKKAKDAKTREFFEKQFPELKKQREDKERMTRVGQRIRSDAEWEEIIEGFQEQELEEKKMRSYAVIPPILLDNRQRKLLYINHNGLIEDLSQEYKEKQMLNIWTDQEKDIFREKYLQHPKNFNLIASCLDRKTVTECVQYYYLTKKSENYKQLLRKHSVRKRTRALVKPQQSQQQQQAQGTGMTTRQQQEEAKTGSSMTSLASSSETVTTTAMDSSTSMLVTTASTTASIPDIVNGNSSSAMPLISNVSLSSPDCMPNSSKVEPKMPTIVGDKDLGHLPNNIRKLKEASKKSDGLDKTASDSDTASDHRNENGPTQPCALCKMELDNLNQSRPLTKSNCSMYGIKDSDLTNDMRVCASCRFKSVRKRCPIPTCKTPKRKVKRLRPLPGKLSELSKEMKDSIILEFQIPPEVNKCCSACFNRIIRKLETNDALASEPAENSRWNDEETEAFKKGLGQFGMDWEAVATSVETKNKEQCRNFYFNYKRKLGLDQILKEKHKADGIKNGDQQDDKPPPIVTDEEESGETTSSCEEDNCVDRCSSDTASAPSPAEKIIEEDKSSDPQAAPFLPTATSAPVLSAEEPRSQPITSMDTNPPCSADYDSSATVSADEGQIQNDNELRDSSPRVIQTSNHHGPKLTIANENVRKAYNPPILKEMESRPEVGVPLVKTLLQDPNIGAGHSELTRPSYLDQPPVKGNKEEPTCVRDLIYQAIEMSLQWPAKPGRNSSPIPGNLNKDSPEIIHVETKVETSGVSIPPVAHCGSHRPSRPGSQHTELNIMDCEVQDLSKKSKSRDSSPPREYIKRERVVTPARPPSESSSSSSHGHYYGAPPPAHCNQYRSSQPPPALSPHYVGEPHHDPYYPRGSEPRNKAYAMAERPHSQPPHLVAQASSTIASTTTTLTSHSKTIVAKSSVPPPPPLIASKPTQLSPKLPYKDRLISVPTGSITQGTPVNQQQPAPGTPINIPSARYEGFLRQLPPPQVKDSGSITLGTPVQHEQIRRIPSGRAEVGGHIPPAVYDPAVVEYFRHVSPVTQPYPFPPGVAGYPPNAVPTRPPYANESQLSSKQIMIDFNTSKQMQLRRGITGDKDLKVSPRGSESNPAPVSETQLHPMYPPVNYQGAPGPAYVNHQVQGNYPPSGDSRFPHHRATVGQLDRNHSPSGTESPVNASFTHPGKRSPGLAQGANRQNVIHRSITWGTGKPSVIQAPQSSSPRIADGRNEASSPAMVRKSTPSPRHPQPLIYQPVPPSGHDAFNTLVNAAVAQPSLVVPKDGKGSPASRQETKSPRDRPVVEGLEKTLIDMHQRPRSYIESTHNNVPHNDNGRSNGDHIAPDNQRHLLGVAPENRRYLNPLPHAGYDMSRESPRHLERQVLISDHHSSSLRLSNMREPFSREQFERQMRQPEVAVSRDRAYIEKDHERAKLVLAEAHGPNYAVPQQSELDNEASKIFSQSFQKDMPRSGSSFTAANLIDAIITRQINQNAEPPAPGKNSDLFNQYHSNYDDSKLQPRPPSTKVNTRAEVVTIDDESDTGKSTPNWNERPSSHGRSPPVQISAAPNVLPVMPVPYATEKVVTLGEHIAAIISKDYNSPNDIHQSPPFYSSSQLSNSASRNSPFTSGAAPHAGSKQLEGIAAALPTDNLLASPNVPRDSPDHSPQNCPGNGCVFHTHSWKLRRALQQDKEREHRSPALTDNAHPRSMSSQVVGSPVNQDERQIIRVSQTSSSVQTTVRSSPVTSYAVEPISPPTHPSDGMNMMENSNRNRMIPKSTGSEMSHSQSPAWTSNPSLTGLLTTRHLYPQEYPDGTSLPPPGSHYSGAPPPSQANGGTNRPPHHQQQQMGLSPLDYVKNRIVEVMRTATDDNPESHESQRRLHPGHNDERDHHQMQQHLYKFQQQTPDREVASERPCSTGSGIPQLASQRYSPAVSRYSPVPPRPSSAAERVPSRNSTPGEQLQRNHKRSLEGHHGLQEWRDGHRPAMSSRSPPDSLLDSPLPRKKMRSDSTFIPENTIDHAPILLPENSSGVHRVPHTEAPRLSTGGHNTQPVLDNRSSVKPHASTNSVVSTQAECFTQSGQTATENFRHSSELRSDTQWEVISTRDRVLENNRLHSSNSASSSVAETTSPVARDSVSATKPMDTSRSDNENCPVSSSNAGLHTEPNRSSPGGSLQRQTPNNSSHYPPFSVSNSGVNNSNTTSSLPPSSNQHLAYSSFSSLNTTYAYPYSALSMRSLTTSSTSHNSTPVTNSTVSGTPHPSPIPISNQTRNSPSPLARNNSSNSNQPPPLLSSQYEPLSDED